MPMTEAAGLGCWRGRQHQRPTVAGRQKTDAGVTTSENANLCIAAKPNSKERKLKPASFFTGEIFPPYRLPGKRKTFI
jgi:hypothetical protein